MSEYYIHITTQCNMSCAHCAFDYGNGKKGKHMPLDMFRHIMKLALDEDAIVTIGGGEICLYPEFEQMIGILACYANKEYPPFIVTNGSITERALMLDRLANTGLIGCELSQDEFHDPISSLIVQLFAKRNATRTVTKAGALIYAGRAKTQDAYELQKICPCDAVQFYPTGIVKWCGCPRSPIITRNVMSDWKYPENFSGDGCYKHAEKLVET